MATKAWFDYGTYMANKLAQMQETYPNEKWTAASLQKAFEDAGFVGDEGAFKHFQKYGHKEDVSPNKYFDADYYYQSKAIQYYGLEANGGLTKAEVEANMATYAKNMEGAIKAAGMDAWTHYIKYGTAEGVNPSNSFDTSDYMAAKLAALQAAEPSANWDEASMNAAFKKAGLNALEHFMQYAGKGDNEVTSTDIADFEVPDSEKIDGGNAGDTFTLTTGTDTFTGTAKDDTFAAGEVSGNKTLTAGDDLDGGEGTDTLKVAHSATNGTEATYSGFTAKNIEVLDATADGGAQTFDLSGTDGLTTLRSTNSSAGVTFDRVNTLANMEAVRLTGTPGITVRYENATVSGDKDEVSLTLNSSNIGTVKLGSVADDNAGIESLALTATGGNSTVAAIDSDISTLTFSGDKNVTITESLNKTVKTIDASAATGGLKAKVGDYGDNDVAFTGGKGDDQIDFGATLTASDSVKGGEGTDRVIAYEDNLAQASGKISGVEIIRVGDTANGTSTTTSATDTLNAGAFSDATTFELGAGYNNARINNFTANQTRVDVLSGPTTGTLTLQEASTEFTLGVGDAAATTENVVNAVVAFENNKVTTLNVESNGKNTDRAVVNTLDVTAPGDATSNVTTINITGAQDLTLSTDGTAVTTIAGGEATGNLDLTNVGLSAKGATITTGSGADSVGGSDGKDTIVTGAGNDIVNGSQGADTITLGDGADTVIYTALTQSSATARDTITDFVNGTDKIDITKLFAKEFVGTESSFGDAQGALLGNGEVSAVFDASNHTLWVDNDGNGTLDSNDFRVTLSNVSTLDKASVTTGTGSTAVVAGGPNTGSDDDDLFVGSWATLETAGTTVDGGLGRNTLNVTDAVSAGAPAATALNFAAGAPALTNIQVINFLKGTPVIANATSATIHNADDVVINASAKSNVTLGTGARQTFNGSSQNDEVVLGAPNQIVKGNSGADVVTTTAANLVGSTLDGGAGRDTLAVNGDISATTGTFTNFEVLNIGNAATTLTADQYNSFGEGVIGTGALTITTAGDLVATSTSTPVSYTFQTAGSSLDVTAMPQAGNPLAPLTFVIQGAASTAATGDHFTVKSSTYDIASTVNGTTADPFDTLTVLVDNAFDADTTAMAAHVGTIEFTGSTAGLKFKADNTNTDVLTTVNVSGYTGGATIDMNNLAATAQTIVANNGGSDTIKLAAVANVASTVSVDAGDTITAGAAVANGALTVNVYSDASGVGNLTINKGTATSIAASKLLFYDNNKVLAEIDSINGDGIATQGSITAYVVNAAAGSTIKVDLDANGSYGSAGDIEVSLVGIGMTATMTPTTDGGITFTAA